MFLLNDLFFRLLKFMNKIQVSGFLSFLSLIISYKINLQLLIKGKLYDLFFIIPTKPILATKNTKPSVPKTISAFVAYCPSEEFTNKNAG